MKQLLLSVFFISLLALFAGAQQDTIIGWVFPTDTATSFNAEFGLSGNLGYDLRAEDTSYTARTITLTNGAGGSGDYAATSVKWDNGAYSKNWSIKFKASGYSDFKVSAVLRAGGTNAGPKYFSAQCRFSGGAWDTLTDTLILGNNWTSGVMTEVPLPSSYDNPGSTSIYIRWISITDSSVNNTIVDSLGVVKIDNIMVTGTNSSGKNEVIYDGSLKVFPNPASSFIKIESAEEIETVDILNVSGQVVLHENPFAATATLNTNMLEKGMYLVRVKYRGIENYSVQRIIIE